MNLNNKIVCFLCHEVTTETRKSTQIEWETVWLRKCSESVSQLLDLEGFDSSFFESGYYCPECMNLVREVDLNFRTVSSLNTRLSKLRAKIANYLLASFDDIIQKDAASDIILQTPTLSLSLIFPKPENLENADGDDAFDSGYRVPCSFSPSHNILPRDQDQDEYYPIHNLSGEGSYNSSLGKENDFGHEDRMAFINDKDFGRLLSVVVDDVTVNKKNDNVDHSTSDQDDPAKFDGDSCPSQYEKRQEPVVEINRRGRGRPKSSNPRIVSEFKPFGPTHRRGRPKKPETVDKPEAVTTSRSGRRIQKIRISYAEEDEDDNNGFEESEESDGDSCPLEKVKEPIVGANKRGAGRPKSSHAKIFKELKPFGPINRRERPKRSVVLDTPEVLLTTPGTMDKPKALPSKPNPHGTLDKPNAPPAKSNRHGTLDNPDVPLTVSNTPKTVDKPEAVTTSRYGRRIPKIRISYSGADEDDGDGSDSVKSVCDDQDQDFQSTSDDNDDSDSNSDFHLSRALKRPKLSDPTNQHEEPNKTFTEHLAYRTSAKKSTTPTSRQKRPKMTERDFMTKMKSFRGAWMKTDEDLDKKLRKFVQTIIPDNESNRTERAEDECDETLLIHLLRCEIEEFHEAASTYICTHLGCLGRFLNLETLRNHKLLQHGEYLDTKPFECFLCHFRCPSEVILNSHFRQLHELDDRPEHCEVTGCGKAFPLGGALNRHMMLSHADIYVPYLGTGWCQEYRDKAPMCNETFPSTRRRKKLRSATTPKPRSHFCTVGGCHYRTASEEFLKFHRLQVHEKVSRPFSCSNCGKAFKLKDTYNRHACVSKTTDQCEHCGKTFKVPYFLKLHIREVHKDMLKFKCSVCHRCYAQPEDVEQHEKYHTTSTAFKCVVRGCTSPNFETLEDLRAHATGSFHDLTQKTCICEQCGYVVKGKLAVGRLKRHMRKHSNDPGDSPYKCNFCDKRFKSSSLKFTHTQINHPDLTEKRIYSCKQCDATFTVAQYLYKHNAWHKFGSNACRPIAKKRY